MTNKSKAVRTVQILERAKELISDPEHWVKNILVTNAHGHVISITSPSATHFCALGAWLRAEFELTGRTHVNNGPDRALMICAPEENYVNYNNRKDTTHENIMNLFSAAIEYARTQVD